VVLAAGTSRRTAPINKLLVEVGGATVVQRVVAAALTSEADPVFVVLGHQAGAVAAVLGAAPVRIVRNERFNDGLSASIRAGIGAIGPGVDGALFLLADMPFVGVEHIARMVNAFRAGGADHIWVPTYGGIRGNPVLWGRRYFAALSTLAGDRGGRPLFRRYPAAIREVAMPNDAVLRDLDDAAALAAAAQMFDSGR
jgi:molybdenum cofactor cytidylyltransferase